MLTAGQIMTPGVTTIRPEATLQEAIDTLLNLGISGLPVVDDQDRLVGVITEFALLAMAYDKDILNATVEQHMTREVITADASDPLSRIADLCIVHRVRRVPVIEEGRLVGLLSRRDVLKAMCNTHAPVCTA